jgi:hypothetical protein
VAKGNDPGSKQYNAWPSVGQMIGWAEAALGSWSGIGRSSAHE